MQRGLNISLCIPRNHDYVCIENQLTISQDALVTKFKLYFSERSPLT